LTLSWRKLRDFLGAILVCLFIALTVLNEDNPGQYLAFSGIIIVAHAICQIGKPVPSGIVETNQIRRTVEPPEEVGFLLFVRWVVVIGGMLFAGIFKAPLLLSISIAAFLLLTEYASCKFHREDREGWEIYFDAESDGCADGDGD